MSDRTAPPYPESTRPFPGLAVPLDHFKGLNSTLQIPARLWPAAFYAMNESLQNYPPGTWAEAASGMIASRCGVDEEIAEKWLLSGWVLHSDGRYYHKATTHLVLKEIERREKNRAAVTRYRNKDKAPEPEKVEKPIRNGDRIPYQEIVNAYNETLSATNPACLKLTNARKAQIRARWNDCMGSLEEWKAFFVVVSRSRFLTGRTGGNKPFRPDIGWLTKEENFTKVYEGKYE